MEFAEVQPSEQPSRSVVLDFLNASTGSGRLTGRYVSEHPCCQGSDDDLEWMDQSERVVCI